MKIQRLVPKDKAFPQALRDIPDPPQELYTLGSLEVAMAQPCLAVVGSRKVTPYGKQVTASLTSEVTGQGVTIISGLALGVDAVAHRAALDANGLTIAVLASGLDTITPTTNYHLAEEILKKGGALVSEYPPGTPPYPASFIARNRLVAGLSDAVLITEAAVKSGTLHTANFALEQGRDVMAVPGNITAPMSQGTNNLIRSGALPVTSAADIFLVLGLDTRVNQQAELFGNTPEETTLLKLLQNGITDATHLLQESRLSAANFNQTLTMLEITGRIYPLGAGHWALK